MAPNNEIIFKKFCPKVGFSFTKQYKISRFVLSFQNNFENLDPSYRIDLVFWIVLEETKTPSYNRINSVPFIL